MRNSKVRARIAAGKLKLRVRDLRNLGARSEQMLAQIGVHSAQELRRRGPVRAFFELKSAGISSSLNMLWALAGALEPWPEGQVRACRCCWRSRTTSGGCRPAEE
jgi:hypothetical protein